MSGLEPLAIVGAISACSQLAGGLAELVTIITHTIQDSRYTPSYISDLKNDTQVFDLCLNKLIAALNKSYQNDRDSEEARTTVHLLGRLVSRGDELCKEIYKLVMKAERQVFATFASLWLNKLGLIFKRSAVQWLQTSLQNLRSNIQLLGCTVTIENLNAQIDKLRRGNKAAFKLLKRQVKEVKQELEYHKGLAAGLRRDLKRQAKEHGLQKELKDELIELRGLHQCLHKKIAKVAPELAFRPKKTTSGHNASPASRQYSHADSIVESPGIATAPNSLQSTGRYSGASLRHAPKRPRRPSNSPRSSIDLPSDHAPYSNRGVSKVSKAPIQDAVFSEQEDASKMSHSDLRTSITGPVISVGEDCRVEEVHREWHPEASMPFRDDGDDTNASAPEAEEGSAANMIQNQDENLKYSPTRCPMATMREGDKQKHSTAEEAGVGNDVSSLRQTPTGSTRLNDVHKHRVRRAKRDVGFVDIFSQSEADVGNVETNKAGDALRKPVPPFDANDLINRQRPAPQSGSQ